MNVVVINYFRKNLREKLPRAMCGRFLPLWDDQEWIKRQTDINLDYIEANDFLVFLYQTKKDICCHSDVSAQCLSNAIDKFFFLMFDFQSYFEVFIQAKYYKNRIEIVQEVLNYKTKNVIPNKLISTIKYLELFIDLTKKITEWDFWRRQVIVNFVKIILGRDNYKSSQKNDLKYLQKLINNVEQLFFNGLNN